MSFPRRIVRLALGSAVLITLTACATVTGQAYRGGPVDSQSAGPAVIALIAVLGAAWVLGRRW